MKTKKIRETRTAYRTRASKPKARTRVARLRAPKAVATAPWRDRIAPTQEQLRDWDAWLNEHEPEFEESYPGQFLAIWDRQIIAVGNTRKQVYAQTDQVRPQVIPLITFIPASGEIAFAPSNFPIEWMVSDAERSD